MRSAGSSYGMPARSIFRNPPSSPIGAHLAGGLDGRLVVGRRDRVVLALGRHEALAARAVRVIVVRRKGALLLGAGQLGQHALVVGREDLDETPRERVPLVEDAPAHRRAGAADVL